MKTKVYTPQSLSFVLKFISYAPLQVFTYNRKRSEGQGSRPGMLENEIG